MQVKTCHRVHHAVPSAVTKTEDAMNYNLADLPQDEMDKVNVDLAAAGVAL